MLKPCRFLERMMMMVSRMDDLCVLAIGNCANDIDNAMMMAMLMTAMMLQLMMTAMLQLMTRTMMTFSFACYWQLLATDLYCSDSTNTTNKLQQTTDCQLIAGCDDW